MVFNKAAEQEASRRFVEKGLGADERVTYKTMHGLCRTKSGVVEIDEHKLLEHIKRKYEKEMKGYISRSGKKHHGEVYRLIAGWILKTLEKWYKCFFWNSHLVLSIDLFRMNSSMPESDLGNEKLTPFKIRKRHEKVLGFDCKPFYSSKAKEIWHDIKTLKSLMVHDAYVKICQLKRLSFPEYTTILVDECQDLNECQMDLFVNQPRSNGKNVIVCG